MVNNMIKSKAYMKHEDVPESQEIFVNGFNPTKTDKIEYFVKIGCESDELFENDELFKLWSNKLLNEEVERRSFKILGCPFMTLVKQNIFIKSSKCILLNTKKDISL